MVEQDAPAPSFYARRGGRVGDWWTLLHPPYTLWHLGYVVLGAAMAPAVDGVALAASVLAFFLAVGVAAHALDELHGRPLRTSIGDGVLRTVATIALLGACALGVVGAFFHGSPSWALMLAVPVGGFLVVGYNLELYGGRLHTDRVFALAWGGFPVVVGFVAQAPPLTWGSAAAVAAATAAGVGTSSAQRVLSTQARDLRRRTVEVSGSVLRVDGSVQRLDREGLLAPLEGALRALSWAVPLVATAALLARL
jgi:hypothetical protein